MYKPIVISRNKKYGNNYWNSDGPKVNMREVVLYSDLEFDHWVLVDTDPTVKTYCEQPVEICFVVDGKLHTSIIDMWILRASGEEEYIEVKYDIELQPNHPNFKRNMRQIQAQREWCNNQGLTHKVMTERAIRAFPIGLENRLKMLSYMKSRTRPIAADDVLQVINESPKTIGQIHVNLKEGYSISEIMYSCYWLTYFGKILANINQQIWSLKTEVRRNESYEGC